MEGEAALASRFAFLLRCDHFLAFHTVKARPYKLRGQK